MLKVLSVFTRARNLFRLAFCIADAVKIYKNNSSEKKYPQPQSYEFQFGYFFSAM
jgi:hypothetical protein